MAVVPADPSTDPARSAAGEERETLDQVFAVLHPELRRLAQARLREPDGGAPAGTADHLERSFRRRVDAGQLEEADRERFFRYAAGAIRKFIVEFARQLLAEQQAVRSATAPLDAPLTATAPSGDGVSLLVGIGAALEALEALDPELVTIVEMRYFAGFGDSEIAGLLGTSGRRVYRQWEKARAYLVASLNG